MYLRAATASWAPTMAKSYSSAVPGAGLMSACISSMLQLCATCPGSTPQASARRLVRMGQAHSHGCPMALAVSVEAALRADSPANLVLESSCLRERMSARGTKRLPVQVMHMIGWRLRRMQKPEASPVGTSPARSYKHSKG